MRVALLLLMLLAVAALPGSFVPQRPAEPERVARYLADNPDLGEWLDRFGLFDVYSSPWFSAVYLLLFISLVGCIVPRIGAHARALRAEPPRVPRSLARFPVRVRAHADAAPADVQRAALASLRGRYRASGGSEPPPGGLATGATAALTVRAERGYLRESGNLLFHVALVGVLVAVALGQLLGHGGQMIVVEGRGVANAVVDYDSFHAGAWFRDDHLTPFTLGLESFEAEFDPATLQARDFTAHVALAEPGRDSRAALVKVNHPLRIGSTAVYLTGNGYAPTLTVRDVAGRVAFAGPVPFLPQDAVYTSRGVVKVPDVSPGQEQIGIVGFLLPTALVDDDGPRSVFPQPIDPLLVLTVYSGDLGLDDGVPQNAYELDTAAMAPALGADGRALSISLRPGETAELPGGLGSVTFDALPRFVALDVRDDPAEGAVLAFALLAITGLGLSLFVPRRRLWLRLTDGDDGRTVIDAAALARGDDPGLAADLDRVVEAARRAISARSQETSRRPPSRVEDP
jgi:cytochrome c biogenesis protein